MASLQFTGTDYRDLIDTLIETVNLARDGDRPAIEVSGKIYGPSELLKVAALLPDDNLQPHHQLMIDSIFRRKQHGYRRTACNLVLRAASDAVKSKQQEVPAPSEHRPFATRGLSDRTIKALLEYGIDAPERLLFMTPAQLRGIPGVGKLSFREVMRYRAQFVADSLLLERLVPPNRGG